VTTAAANDNAPPTNKPVKSPEAESAFKAIWSMFLLAGYSSW